MLAVAGTRSVPTDVHRGIAPREQFQMCGRSPKGVRPETRGLVVWAPTDETNIEAATRSAFEHVQCTPTTAWHTKCRPHERDRGPDTVPGAFDRLADSIKRWFAVDPRCDCVARPCGVRSYINERYRGSRLGRAIATSIHD